MTRDEPTPAVCGTGAKPRSRTFLRWRSADLMAIKVGQQLDSALRLRHRISPSYHPRRLISGQLSVTVCVFNTRRLDMFSSRLCRVTQRAATSTPSLSTAPSSTAAHRPVSSFAHRPSQQRRLSSSKASCPPDSNKPAPDAKAAVAGDATSPASAPVSQRPSPKRLSRGKRFQTPPTDRATVRSREVADQWAGLPAVPNVQHWNDRGERMR